MPVDSEKSLNQLPLELGRETPLNANSMFSRFSNKCLALTSSIQLQRAVHILPDASRTHLCDEARHRFTYSLVSLCSGCHMADLAEKCSDVQKSLRTFTRADVLNP